MEDKKDVKCSLCVVLDNDSLKKAKIIQELRKRHDKTYDLWMPRLNLLHPFIPESEFLLNLPVLEAAIADVAPFDLTFDRFAFFHRKKGSIIYLAPSATSEELLKNLQRKCEQAFPFCDEVSTYSDEGYLPHLTIGGFTKEETEKKVFDFNKQWTRPLVIRVDEIQLCAQKGKAHRAAIIHNVKLGTKVGDGEKAVKDSSLSSDLRDSSTSETTTASSSTANSISVKSRITRTNNNTNDHDDDEGPMNVSGLFSSRPTFKFCPEDCKWREVEKAALTANNTVDKLVVLSYNILFDLYDKEKIHTEQRTELLLELLKEANADVVGLIEVTQRSLIQILRNEWMQQTYYISECEFGTSVNPYGQVLLSKIPFAVLSHAYSTKKRAICGVFKINNRTLNLPVVHLTSGSSNKGFGKGGLVQRRSAQMGVLYDKFTPFDDEIDDASDCLIMGDFNMGDGDEGEFISIREDFVDAWKLLKYEDPGYTFNPEVNEFASLNSESRKKKRIDRILLRSQKGHWNATTIDIIGDKRYKTTIAGAEKEIFVSDHFGLKCTINFNENPTPVVKSATAPTQTLELKNTINLASYIEKFSLGCTEENNAIRGKALAKLKSALLEVFISETEFRLYCLGSYALGIHSVEGDIDCVCVGTMERHEFFSKAKNTLAATPDIRVKKVLLDSFIPILTLSVLDIEFDIQYCSYYKGFSTGYDIKSPADVNTKRLDEKSLHSINGYLDTIKLKNEIPNMKKFQDVILCVKYWAKQHGFYSNALGFFGGYSWVILVVLVCQLYPKASTGALLHYFFGEFANWNWDSVPVSILQNPDPTLSFKMKAYERMVVLTLNKPYFNSARNVCRSTKKLMVQAFQEAKTLLATQQYDALFAPTQFFTLYKGYLQIKIEAITRAEFTSWIGYIESRLIVLFVKLENLDVPLIVHPNPTRYANANPNYPFSCCYYIGFDVEKKEGQNNVLNIGSHLIDFRERLMDWSGYSQGMFTKLTVVKTANLPSPLEKYNIDGVQEEEALIESDEDEITIGESDIVVTEKNPSGGPGEYSVKSKCGQVINGKLKKLEMSDTIYHRILWDPAFNAEDYVMGYLDRFVGMKEITVLNFRDPNTDETEYIPFHRVWYIRHKSGKIMWDRKNRFSLF